jgi:hypothetical protein
MVAVPRRVAMALLAFVEVMVIGAIERHVIVIAVVFPEFLRVLRVPFDIVVLIEVVFHRRFDVISVRVVFEDVLSALIGVVVNVVFDTDSEDLPPTPVRELHVLVFSLDEVVSEFRRPGTAALFGHENGVPGR